MGGVYPSSVCCSEYCWPSPRPVTVLYETGSESGEAAHSLSKHAAYLVVIFLWSLRQEVLIIKQPKLIRVELAPALRVVRFQALSGRPSEEEAETKGEFRGQLEGGRDLVSVQVRRAEEQGATARASRLELSLLMLGEPRGSSQITQKTVGATPQLWSPWCWPRAPMLL